MNIDKYIGYFKSEINSDDLKSIYKELESNSLYRFCDKCGIFLNVSDLWHGGQSNIDWKVRRYMFENNFLYVCDECANHNDLERCIYCNKMYNTQDAVQDVSLHLCGQCSNKIGHVDLRSYIYNMDKIRIFQRHADWNKIANDKDLSEEFKNEYKHFLNT